MLGIVTDFNLDYVIKLKKLSPFKMLVIRLQLLFMKYIFTNDYSHNGSRLFLMICYIHVFFLFSNFLSKLIFCVTGHTPARQTPVAYRKWSGYTTFDHWTYRNHIAKTLLCSINSTFPIGIHVES